MVRSVMLCVALVAFGAINAEAREPVGDPEGVYNCTGFNPDGSAYTAMVQITKVDHTYRVLWVLPNSTWVMGIGILSGDVFAVSYYGGAPAIVVYRQDGERLTGEWTVGGSEGAVYSETLIKMPGHPPLNPAAPSAPVRSKPIGVPDRSI